MLPITVLILGFFTLSGSAAPSKPRCRCVTMDESLPWTSSPALLAASGGNDVCSRLGPELEHWRLVEPSEFDAYFKEFIEETPSATPTEDEQKPLSTTILMELAQKKGFDPDAPASSAPTTRSRERIICRSEPEEAEEYRASSSSLFAIGVIIVMVVLACLAECVDLLMTWVNRYRQRKGTVKLQGGEKDLHAFEPQQAIYTSALYDGDEDHSRSAL